VAAAADDVLQSVQPLLPARDAGVVRQPCSMTMSRPSSRSTRRSSARARLGSTTLQRVRVLTAVSKCGRQMQGLRLPDDETNGHRCGPTPCLERDRASRRWARCPRRNGPPAGSVTGWRRCRSRSR
jgi:hypothetical protein